MNLVSINYKFGLNMDSKDRERDRTPALPEMRLDFRAMRKRAVGDETDQSITDLYLASLVKMAALYFVDERNWYSEEDSNGTWYWSSSMEIAYPIHVERTYDPCEKIRADLSKALGPNVIVQEIDVDYRDDFAFGSILCVQELDD